MHEMRRLMMIVEGRDPNIEYQTNATSVVAKLKSHNSATYTKLAQKIEKIDALEAEIKQLKNEVKSTTKENIAGLFDASDAVFTRVVETIQFVFTLTKDPKPTETVKYKEVLDELATHLTPELIKVMESLKEKYKSVSQRSPSLSLKTNESIVSTLKGWIQKVFNWAKNYDSKLEDLKSSVNLKSAKHPIQENHKDYRMTKEGLSEFSLWLKSLGISDQEIKQSEIYEMQMSLDVVKIQYNFYNVDDTTSTYMITINILDYDKDESLDNEYIDITELDVSAKLTNPDNEDGYGIPRFNFEQLVANSKSNEHLYKCLNQEFNSNVCDWIDCADVDIYDYLGLSRSMFH